MTDDPAAGRPSLPAPYPQAPASYQQGPAPAPYPAAQTQLYTRPAAQAPYPYQPGPPPRGPGLPRPVAVLPIPETPFGIAVVGVAPTISGPAVASLVVGVGSILVALVVGCFGVVGADAGWGPMVSGAFAVLGGLAGAAALVLGRMGLRQIKRVAGAVTGRGVALAGIICGASGLALVVLAFVSAIALTAGA